MGPSQQPEDRDPSMGQDDDQVRTNEQTWSALQDNGVLEGSDLEVDAFLFAPDQEAAALLTGDLERAGWSVTVSPSRHGLLRRRTVWALEATRVLPDVGRDVLDAMVVSLEAMAAGHGAELDGWGAEAPGPR